MSSINTAEFLSKHAAMLNKASERFKNAQPNTGEVLRPAAGVGICALTSLDLEDVEYGLKDGAKFPGTRITFRYQTINDPLYPDGLSFPGKGFTILGMSAAEMAANGIPAGTIKSFEIDDGRLAGHVQTITGSPSSKNLAADIQAIQAVLDAQAAKNEALAVRIRHQYDKDKKNPDRTYYKEFLLGVASGSPA